MGKISFNQIDKIIEKNVKDSGYVYSYEINETESVNIEIKRTLNADEQVSFVESVVSALFTNGKYMPSLYSLVFGKALFAYYTNIKTDDIKNDRLIGLIYNTDIIKVIKDNINTTQYLDIIEAIDKQVDYTINFIMYTQKTRLDEAIDNINIEQENITRQMNSITDTFKKFSDGLDEYGKEQLAQDIHKISAMDERKVIENIIDVQNKTE